jgi:bifunctional non-homologous end joining protein LigD
MLPHLEGRPLALQRWPDGIDGEAWFEQHAPPKVPEAVRVVSIEGRRHLLAENRETLAWLANLAALTIHQWASHVPSGTPADRVSEALAHPDYVVFDLDPGDGPFADVVAVARALHRALDALELESVVKTSGQRGLHVVVPIARVHGFDDAQGFARTVATAVARHLPELATIERSLAKRRGRLYVDFLQNGRGKTIVAPYSVRAVDGAPVSTPIAWSEVTERLDPSKLTIATVPRRLVRHGDLFARALAGTARLPARGH